MNRVQSIDVFRGFTIFMMVFVNDLAGVANIPLWMKHVPAEADAMTFVDVVFPAFLFIVGMSLPLAIRIREARGESMSAIARHILIRTAGLLVLGIFMVNAEEMNREANLINPRIWNLLFYACVIVVWNQYPSGDKKRNLVWQGFRIAGMLVLLLLWWTYRKGEPGALTGMTHSWWGILGLIGWAYLLSVIIYLIFRENMAAIAASVALFTAIALGLKSESLWLPDFLLWLKGQSGHFVHASLTLAGMLLAVLFTEYSPADTWQKRLRWMLVAGVFAAIAAFFLRPYFGISKIYATPSWALYCVAICCWLFSAIYWLVDVKGIRKWAVILEPAGKNPLLTYILPAIVYHATGGKWLPDVLYSGAPGFFKAVAFSFVILGISALLTKWRIKLQL